ncbi:MAG: YeeE/YedE family protein [Rhodospirillaceae bacterium]|nr:YeeE/YedE family protein [Rhodospirillaceae bacterium]
MRSVLGGLAAGLLFGTGLAISGMINPAKVMAFLDIAGAWDPSLAFVMLGALLVAGPGYRLILRRSRPLFEDAFVLPARRELDSRLLAGAALFGIGWGLGGYCPGPALAALGFGKVQTLAFAAAMAAGMIAARYLPAPAAHSGVRA